MAPPSRHPLRLAALLLSLVLLIAPAAAASPPALALDDVPPVLPPVDPPAATDRPSASPCRSAHPAARSPDDFAPSAEPSAAQPDPVFASPEPSAAQPDPVFASPEPSAVQPDPVFSSPEPSAPPLPVDPIFPPASPDVVPPDPSAELSAPPDLTDPIFTPPLASSPATPSPAVSPLDPVMPTASVTPGAISVSPATPPSTPPSPPAQSNSPPSPTPAPVDGVEASCYTDPHLRTFDGLSYDCQAVGEFVLTRAAAASVELRARFAGASSRGTVTTGVASRVGALPVVQLSLASSATSNSTDVIGCPIMLYVDGIALPLSSGTGLTDVSVVASSDASVRIAYANGVAVSFRVAQSAAFGCFFESLRVFLPRALAARGPVHGLLGSPNRDASDDWMKPSGQTLTPPASQADRLFEKAYNYCTENWCVRDERASLFTYETGSSFSSSNGCDKPYEGAVDLTTASPQLRAICQDDTACLVDGLAGDVDDARRALAVQARLDTQLGARAEFAFSPASITAGESVNVEIKLDVSRRPAAQRRGLQSFALFRADSETGTSRGTAIAFLRDDGSALSSDDIAGDAVFSNTIALEASRGGQTFAFRAVPVIDGAQVPDSPLTTTALTGVRAVSRGEDIGAKATNRTEVSVPTLDGLELVAFYSWALDQDDLDTATTFAGETAGYACPGARDFLEWDGDVTSNGGTEAVRVELARARAEGKWSTSTTVSFACGWFISGAGPATLRMVLRNVETKKEVSGSAMSMSMVPGVQDGCASTEVAKLEVTVGKDVTLVLSRA